MEVYLSGLGLNGIKQIDGPKDRIYIAIPKELKGPVMVTNEDMSDLDGYHKCNFKKAVYEYVKSIPVYKLVDIE